MEIYRNSCKQKKMHAPYTYIRWAEKNDNNSVHSVEPRNENRQKTNKWQ